MFSPRDGAAFGLFLASLLAAPSALGFPRGLQVQGTLTNSGGVISGSELLRFQLFSAPSGGTAMFEEIVEVDVIEGVFDTVFGGDPLAPLLPEPLADAAELWISVSVEGSGGDWEELSRKPLRPVFYAYSALLAADAERADVAATALSLECTGCVTMSSLDGALQQAVMAAGAVAAADLPADGLTAVSNGTLSNALSRTYGATGLPLSIGASVEASVEVPEPGALTSVEVYVALTHPFHPDLAIELVPPSGVTLTLVGSGTVQGQGIYTRTFSAAVGGGLGSLIGSPASGAWRVRVIDTVINGNEATGLLTGASVTVGFLASDEVEVRGTLNLTGHALKNARLELRAGPTVPCDASSQGLIFLDTSDQRVKVCIGTAYVALNSACGDGNVQAPEGCDDGGTAPGDGCSATCTVESGYLCTGSPKSVCTLNCADGITFDGVCLRPSVISSNADSVPPGCNAYRPARTWTQGDFQSICQQFNALRGMSVGCSTVDTDGDGGRCSNFLAIASWETEAGQKATPDVWLHASTFSWTMGIGNAQCRLHSDPSQTLVIYACQ